MALIHFRILSHALMLILVLFLVLVDPQVFNISDDP